MMLHFVVRVGLGPPLLWAGAAFQGYSVQLLLLLGCVA